MAGAFDAWSAPEPSDSDWEDTLESQEIAGREPASPDPAHGGTGWTAGCHGRDGCHGQD